MERRGPACLPCLPSHALGGMEYLLQNRRGRGNTFGGQATWRCLIALSTPDDASPPRYAPLKLLGWPLFTLPIVPGDVRARGGLNSGVPGERRRTPVPLLLPLVLKCLGLLVKRLPCCRSYLLRYTYTAATGTFHGGAGRCWFSVHGTDDGRCSCVPAWRSAYHFLPVTTLLNSHAY